MTTSDSDSRVDNGVQFASIDGRRSSTAAARSIFASAVQGVDEDLARDITRTKDWRKSYLTPVRRVVERGIASPRDATRIATDGLASLREHLVYVDGDREVPLPEAFRKLGTEPMQTTVVKGEGDADQELVVPYGGTELRGDRLRAQLERWSLDGVLEPSAATALESVIGNPDWLDLSDRTFVLLGASSQMGPLEYLARWRANIAAVDLPRPHLWDTVLDLVKKGAGRVHIPSLSPATQNDIRGKAGADLLLDAPRVARWVTELDGPLTLGNYVYADGGNFVRLAGSVDALIDSVLETRDDVSLAYLATPTDAFAVPSDIAKSATADRKRRWSRAGSVLRPLTAGKTFVPNYSHRFTDSEGDSWAIADSLIPIQGPNYALAKALQRWRAVVARQGGIVSSANVAPSTRTASVTKNRMLAAAYRGAGSFGVEIFEPETSRAVMAALLVHDLRNPQASAHPGVDLGHPLRLFSEAAVHGGLWRLPWEARSVLPLALLLGAPRPPRKPT